MLLCNSVRLVNVAAAQLSTHSYVFVDCEGRDLGDATGALSTIAIGTPKCTSVFLFDALRLDASALKPITDILTSTRIAKVVWDGKMDAIEFKRTFGITMNKVWDLQLLDITTRARRGDRDGRKYIDRPWHPLKLVAHLDLDGVYGLTGLKQAMKAHFISDTVVPDPGPGFDHSLWMERPLPEVYLSYAEGDIRIMARMYAHFQSRRYMDKQQLATLEQQSQRYLSVHPGPVPNRSGNPFACSNMLPAEVISPPLAGPKQTCDKCLRVIAAASFFYPSLRFSQPTRHTSCKTCHVLVERNNIKEKLAEEALRKKEEKQQAQKEAGSQAEDS